MTKERKMQKKLRDGIILGGNSIYAQRVLLTALLKSDEKIKRYILQQVRTEHFTFSRYNRIFHAIEQSIQECNKIDSSYLPKKIEIAIRQEWTTEVESRNETTVDDELKRDLRTLNELSTEEIMDEETLNKALEVIEWRRVEKEERNKTKK